MTARRLAVALMLAFLALTFGGAPLALLLLK
jgi:hypothetical protein